MTDMKKEYGEAIEAGENVLLQTDAVLKQLDSARTWGFFDLFSKGGFVSAMVKHSKLDNAEREMNKLRHLLNRFNDELDDLTVYDEVGDIRMEGFMKFADFFFDNPFTDFMALQKINDSRSQVLELKEQVIQILDILYREEGLL